MQVGFFPLIAGLVGSHSRMVGVTLHFVFAIIIGASLGHLEAWHKPQIRRAA